MSSEGQISIWISHNFPVKDHNWFQNDQTHPLNIKNNLQGDRNEPSTDYPNIINDQKLTLSG